MYYFIKRFDDEESAKAALVEFKKTRETFKTNGVLSVAQFRRFKNIVALPATKYLYSDDVLLSMDRLKKYKAFKLAEMVKMEKGLYYHHVSLMYANKTIGHGFELIKGTDNPVFYE